jgi:large subunit ribosomal protein L6
MSRVGRAPIPCPQGVEIRVVGRRVEVRGPKGELSREVHPSIEVRLEDGSLRVIRPTDKKIQKSLHGLTRSLLSNMVKGVTDGFEKRLELEGLGYRALLQGRTLTLHVGFSHPVVYEPPAGISFALDERNKNIVIIRGIDRQQVGQVAADIRAIRKPEPYRGKGIRYVGERVRRKVGKAGA